MLTTGRRERAPATTAATHADPSLSLYYDGWKPIGLVPTAHQVYVSVEEMAPHQMPARWRLYHCTFVVYYRTTSKRAARRRSPARSGAETRAERGVMTNDPNQYPPQYQ